MENGNDMLENFHQSFSEHLVSLESNLRSSFEREKNEAYKKLKEEKDVILNLCRIKLNSFWLPNREWEKKLIRLIESLRK